MSTIFICHSSRDKERFVRRLAADLAEQGHLVWYDDWSIQPGEHLATRISQGIDDCDYFLIVISLTSLKSEWVQHELNAALVREIEQKRVLVIPILIGKVVLATLPSSLRSKKCIRFARLKDSAYQLSLKRLTHSLSTLAGGMEIRGRPLRCPRVEHGITDTFTPISVIDLLCFEQTLGKQWVYNTEHGIANLFFTNEVGHRSEPVRLTLDEEDRNKLAAGPVEPLGFFVYYNTNKDRNNILKLQYRVRGQDYVSLYWINYAMTHFIESRGFEFAGDWDEEVSFKSIKSMEDV